MMNQTLAKSINSVNKILLSKAAKPVHPALTVENLALDRELDRELEEISRRAEERVAQANARMEGK
jgi:hypothetical protein